eukprot:264803-Pyramimonas_sp.AAC.1
MLGPSSTGGLGRGLGLIQRHRGIRRVDPVSEALPNRVQRASFQPPATIARLAQAPLLRVSCEMVARRAKQKRLFTWDPSFQQSVVQDAPGPELPQTKTFVLQNLGVDVHSLLTLSLHPAPRSSSRSSRR